MARSQSIQDNGVYQLKVTLQGTKPAIWRRFAVPASISLGNLHGVLQIVMGWTDSHLHQFIIAGRYFGMPSDEDSAEILDEAHYNLCDVAGSAKSRFCYEYDFGDSWEHEIIVEKILEPDPDAIYPCCLDGARACPPDDCGGVYGFYNLVEAISDPDHPEHEDLLDWIGGSFNPDSFDLQAINKSLSRAFKTRRAKAKVKR